MTAPPAIAIVTHNSEAALERFLAGQLAVAEALGTNLIAVDNASTDRSQEILWTTSRRSPALRVVLMDRNRGYAAGVNAAFAAVPGRDIMLANPDVDLVGPERVRELASVLGRLPQAAVVAPALDHPDGSPQPSARRFPSFASMLATLPGLRATAAGRRAYRHYIGPSEEGRRSALVDWVIGAAMLIRRQAWEELGGWDERFFLYMEDADFCRRCARAGWGVVYSPRVRVRHAYARASSSRGASAVTNVARRRHFVSLGRFWARDPRLLLGLGRRRSAGDRERRAPNSPANPTGRRRVDALLETIG